MLDNRIIRTNNPVAVGRIITAAHPLDERRYHRRRDGATFCLYPKAHIFINHDATSYHDAE